MRKNEKITALYERLSRDDFGKDDDQQRESNSISNQKAMLEEFAARQGFTNIVHFTDDGISGTCFDRPGFLAMMKEVEAGNVEYLCILQSQSQLKTIYKDAAETIIGNCDTMLFLGGKESSTLKEISETLGKETIDLYNTSDTRGNSPSFGTNYQKTGKELMSRDELAVMDGSKCILQLRGVRPFLSDKFDITKHKRYKELSDFDKKNEFDVECYLKHELRLLTTEEFDLYEVDVTEQAQG